MTADMPTETIAAREREATKFRLTRRHFFAAGAGLVCAVPAATVAYAGVVEPMGLVVTRYALTPPQWPAGRKLTIAVVADLHAGGPDMTFPHVKRVIDTTQNLHADLIVLLGDFNAWYRHFHWEPMADPVWAAELTRLNAPLGVWSILGNHDWWHDLAGVRSALAGARIPVLENKAVLLGGPGQRLWLAGLADQLAYPLGNARFRGADDLPGTMAQIDTGDPVLLLAHEPDIFPQVSNRVALTLAGHTHGGQIRVPFLWERYVPSKYGPRYAYGHVVEDDRHLIVSGGLGTSIIPARLGVPPEILHITLGA